MHRQFIAELQARDNVDEIYRVTDKQVRSNRQGNDYLLLQFMDRSGQISGLRWNAGQTIYESFQKGDFLRVLGTTQLHNGMMQIIVQDFETVPSAKVNIEDFAKTSPREVEQLLDELKSILTSVSNPHLKRIVNAYLGDERLVDRLCRAQPESKPTMPTRVACCDMSSTFCTSQTPLPPITNSSTARCCWSAYSCMIWVNWMN